jgi:AAA15 family ATPase/GTPase
MFGHPGLDGRTVFLDVDLESDGTKRLLVLLDQAFRALDRGSVLVVDELDASLHTRAAETVVSLFLSKETNPNGAQLVATTHDTNLLSMRGLRRDEIWFAEKDDLGRTSLFPLTDIHTRAGDNLERGYLQGRFGAIPFAGAPPSFPIDGPG